MIDPGELEKVARMLADGHTVDELRQDGWDEHLDALDRLRPMLNGHRTTKQEERTKPDLWPEPLGPAAHHGLIGDAVRVICPHSEADPAALTLTLLIGCGFLIGPRVRFRVGSVTHSTNSNGLLVGDTARARKGTSWNDTVQVLHRVDPKLWASRILGGFGSGEAVVDEVRDPDNDDPGVTDKRLLVHESEFSRVLKVAAREGSILGEIIRDAYDGGPLQIRSRNKRSVSTRHHISALGHITRHELLRTMTETDQANGFANRHVFFAVRRARLLPDVTAVDDAALTDLAFHLRRNIQQACKQSQPFTRTQDAQRRWRELYVNQNADEPPGLLGALVARDTDHIIRLSLIYAALDGMSEVDVPHLDAAAEIWRYSRDSLRVIFGHLTGNPVADRLYKALADAGADGLTLTQQSQVFGRNVSAAVLEEARRELVEDDRVEEFRTDTGGRPATGHRLLSSFFVPESPGGVV